MLEEAAKKLKELQKENTGTLLEIEDIEYETIVIEQLEKLTENVNTIDTLEKSLVIKEYMQVFKEHMLPDQYMMEKLNDKLK